MAGDHSTRLQFLLSVIITQSFFWVYMHVFMGAFDHLRLPTKVHVLITSLLREKEPIAAARNFVFL